jgi:hypothetical protein
MSIVLTVPWHSTHEAGILLLARRVRLQDAIVRVNRDGIRSAIPEATLNTDRQPA